MQSSFCPDSSNLLADDRLLGHMILYGSFIISQGSANVVGKQSEILHSFF